MFGFKSKKEEEVVNVIDEDPNVKIYRPKDDALCSMGMVMEGRGSAWTKGFGVTQAKSNTYSRGDVDDDNLDDNDIMWDDVKNSVIDHETTSKAWYVGNCTNKEILQQLSGQPDGVFLVRNNPVQEGTFILSYRFKGGTQHALIMTNEQHRVCLERAENSFPTMAQFVYHYTKTTDSFIPCILKENGRIEVVATKPKKRAPAPPTSTSTTSEPRRRSSAVLQACFSCGAETPHRVCDTCLRKHEEGNAGSTNTSKSDGSLKSILKKKDSPKSGNSVSFDEKSIALTHEMAAHARGMMHRIDSKAEKCSYFIGCADPVMAHKAITDGKDGAFVVFFEDDACVDHMFLSYMKEGQPCDTMILCKDRGIHLESSKKLFRCLSSLVEWYASDNSEHPKMLRLSGGINRKTRQGSMHAKLQHRQANWFVDVASEEEASEKIEFEPKGSFVVREVDSDTFVLHYVVDGQVFQVKILATKKGNQVKMEGGEKAFNSVMECVLSACSDDETEPPALPMKIWLRPPKTEATYIKLPNRKGAGASKKRRSKAAAVGIPSKETWLRPDMKKQEIIETLSRTNDGAFFIRKSESRPGCYVLSYKFRNEIHHELILTTAGNTGFLLECNHDCVFPQMEKLVEYYTKPQPELRCPLTFSRAREASVSHSDLARRASRKKSVRKDEGDSPLSRGSRASSSRRSTRQSQGVSEGMLRAARARSSTRSRSNQSPLDPRAKMAKFCLIDSKKDDALAALPKGREGAFVIYHSAKHFAELSYVHKSKVHHISIEKVEGGLRLHKSAVVQPNISALVAFYKIRNDDLPVELHIW